MCNNIVSSYNSFEDCIKEKFGDTVSVLRSHAMSGGCIASVYRVLLSNGKSVVLKKNSVARKEMSDAELYGLQLIARTQSIRVPEVLGIIATAKEYMSVLMYVSQKGEDTYSDENNAINDTDNYWDIFAQQLADLHLAEMLPDFKLDTTIDTRSLDTRLDINTTHTYFGLKKDGEPYHNFIGATPQQNNISHSWVDFFATQRIWVQCEMAMDAGYFSRAMCTQAEKLCANLAQHIEEPTRPSLLHGDLWSGNVLVDHNKRPVLIDPAVYYGHYEAELAFTELFGGFSSRFYDAYSSYLPLDKDYHNSRKHIYNLYHYLNHLNLFGDSYLGAVKHTLSKFY